MGNEKTYKILKKIENMPFIIIAVAFDISIFFNGLVSFTSLWFLSNFLLGLLLEIRFSKTIFNLHKTNYKKINDLQQNIINKQNITLEVVNNIVPEYYKQKINRELSRKDKIIKINFK